MPFTDGPWASASIEVQDFTLTYADGPWTSVDGSVPDVELNYGDGPWSSASVEVLDSPGSGVPANGPWASASVTVADTHMPFTMLTDTGIRYQKIGTWDGSEILVADGDVQVPVGYDVVVGWIQSNMRGVATDWDTSDLYGPDVYMWDHGSSTIVRATEPQSVPEPNTGMGASNTFLKDYAAGNLAPGRRLLMVNVARGGTGFTTPSTNSTGGAALHWRYDLADDANNLARRGVATVQAALDAAGPGARLVAFLANHGSTDGSNNTPKATFKGYLEAWISWMRVQLDAPTVPYVMMQMRPSLLGEGRHNIIDQAQQEVAAASPFVAYAYAPNGAEFNRADSVHFNALGMRAIGHALHNAWQTIN